MISWTRGWLVPWLAAPICCSSNAMLDRRSFVSGEEHCWVWYQFDTFTTAISVEKTSSLFFLLLKKSFRSFERSVCVMVSPWIEIGCLCWWILAPKPAFCPPWALKNWRDQLSFASELSNWFSLNTSWINNLAWWLFLLCRSDPYSLKSKSLQTSCPLNRTGT